MRIAGRTASAELAMAGQFRRIDAEQAHALRAAAQSVPINGNTGCSLLRGHGKQKQS